MTRKAALPRPLARLIIYLNLGAACVFAAPAVMADATPLVVKIGYLGETVPEREPLSLVEVVAPDKGLAGAKLAIDDNNTTGKFLKHSYVLSETILPHKGDLHQAARDFSAAGIKLVVASLTASRLLELASFPEMQDAIIFNIQAQDDELRLADCSINVFNIIPSRAMKADALAQYLISKQWPRWVLISGALPPDKAFADAVRRAAKRFGG
jgi:ABC transporter substrate binding protein (PQQ-dependent alcohol dehydrogenase system)